MLDFDGTLAPFAVDRMSVQVYPSVSMILRRISNETGTRVVLISGRRAHELRGMFPIPGIEIWGSHGMERLFPDGMYENVSLGDEMNEVLNVAANLARDHVGNLVESKIGAVAVHWRGLSEENQHRIRTTVTGIWTPIANENGIAIREFDGGLEVRVPIRDKGDAVRTILGESSDDVCAAYLGDDETDEAAFRAIRDRGLAALVRPRFRTTQAHVWLRPPQELVRFLDKWFHACGGVQ